MNNTTWAPPGLAEFQKKLKSQFQRNLQIGRTDVIYRTLLATAGGPISK